MKKLIPILLFLSFPSYGFLNIEALRQSKSPTGKLKGSTGFRLNDQRGNVQKTQIQLNTLNMIRKGQSSYLLLAQYRYGTSFSREDTRQGHLHFRYTRDLSQAFSWESFTQLEFNEFQALTLRALLGLGLRTQVFKEEKNSLFLGTGAFYERENLKDLPDPSNPRANLYLSYVWNSESVTLSTTVYYQPNLELINDGRLRFNAGLETTFLGKFSQQIDYTITHDSRPPVGIQKTDARISAGLAYRY